MAKKNEFMVVGYKRIDYRKVDGKEVHGCEVYLFPVEADEGVVGQQVEAVYLSDAYSTYKPQEQDIVRKSYNRWGKVEDLNHVV